MGAQNPRTAGLSSTQPRSYFFGRAPFVVVTLGGGGFWGLGDGAGLLGLFWPDTVTSEIQWILFINRAYAFHFAFGVTE